MRGSIRRLTVCVSPPASVAVSSSSRCDGYSWSGAGNEPEATPLQVCTGCVWQFSGSPSQQCWMVSFQLSPEAGIGAPSQSVAPPLKAIVSSTVNCAPAAGVSIRAAGPAPARTVMLSVPWRPPLSVTRSRTVTASGVV